MQRATGVGLNQKKQELQEQPNLSLECSLSH